MQYGSWRAAGIRPFQTRLRMAQIPIISSAGITFATTLCTVHTIPGVDTASPSFESISEWTATECTLDDSG